MPRGGDQDILATAESFAEQAEPLKIEFTKRAFKTNFIETLRAAIADFSQTVNESDTARRERVGTNAAIETSVKTCKSLIGDCDPIVKMHFRGHSQVLAEWLVASHIQRAPHGNDAKSPTPPTNQ